MKKLVAPLVLASLAAVGFFGVVALEGPSDDKIAATKTSEKVAKAPSSPTFSVLTPDNPKPQNNGIERNAAAKALLFGAELGGDFDLIDHFGKPRQLEDYAGKYVLIFFGYANCDAICSTALPLMADTVTAIGKEADLADLVPLMITVDPEMDTPEFMRKRLGEYHPSLIGMTGSDAALADVREKFQVNVELVGEDISGNPIYNHGSFVYLIGPDGKMDTLIPPILDAQQMANIVKKYMTGETSES